MNRLAKRIVYLAWVACGGPCGLGFLQDVPNATEDDVWNNIMNQGDYPCKIPTEAGAVHADYVFGRTMKLYFKYDDNNILFNNMKPNMMYQSWCHKYPTYDALLEAAKKSLEERQ